MDGGTIPGILSSKAKNSCHLLPGDLHQTQFFIKIVLLVANRTRIAQSISPQEQRVVHGQRPFHAVGEELFAVGNVADDFQCGPFAGNGPGTQFVRAHARYSGSQVFDAVFIRSDEIGSTERPSSS